jgi:hypothetical protein
MKINFHSSATNIISYHDENDVSMRKVLHRKIRWNAFSIKQFYVVVLYISLIIASPSHASVIYDLNLALNLDNEKISHGFASYNGTQYPNAGYRDYIYFDSVLLNQGDTIKFNVNFSDNSRIKFTSIINPLSREYIWIPVFGSLNYSEGDYIGFDYYNTKIEFNNVQGDLSYNPIGGSNNCRGSVNGTYVPCEDITTFSTSNLTDSEFSFSGFTAELTYTKIGTPNKSLTLDAIKIIMGAGNIEILSDGPVIQSPKEATLNELVSMSWNAYGNTCSDKGCNVPDGFEIVKVQEFNDYRAVVYKRDEAIVIAFKGTDPLIGPNGAADSAFATGVPNPALDSYVEAAAQLVSEIHNTYPESNIQLTGHSMGGGIAQLVGKASGFETTTFNSAGAALLFPKMQEQLAASIGLSQLDLGILNYRIQEDFVSSGTAQIGNILTAIAPYDFHDLTLAAWHGHDISTVLEAISNGWQTRDGIPDFNKTGPIILSGIKIGNLGKQFLSEVVSGDPYYFDPPPAYGYVFDAGTGPLFTSIGLPFRGDGDSYELFLLNDGDWYLADLLDGLDWFEFDFPIQTFAIGNWPDFGPDANGVVFGLKFVTDGTFNGTVTATERDALLSSVPEPGTLALVALGLAGIAARRVRKQ